jgi:serine phosphatase RsbU (regulator of sigma subunit)
VQHKSIIYHRGHVFPFKRKPDGIWSQQECTIAPPLGVFRHTHTPGTSVDILPGERWTFFTDGLFESLEDGGESEMKQASFLTYLKSRPLLPITEACPDILDRHPSFQTGQPQSDDFTIVMLERDRNTVQSNQ